MSSNNHTDEIVTALSLYKYNNAFRSLLSKKMDEWYANNHYKLNSDAVSELAKEVTEELKPLAKELNI